MGNLKMVYHQRESSLVEFKMCAAANYVHREIRNLFQPTTTTT